MKANQRDRLDQRDAMQRPAGQLKEILVDPKWIQNALMEEAFMDIWVDALYTKIGPRLIADLAAALEEKVQALVEERLQLELGKRLADFESKVIAKILSTIDSAVDFSLDRAIEARTIELLGGQMGPDLECSGIEEFEDALEKAEAGLDELDKTVLLEDRPTAATGGTDTSGEESQPMPTDSAAAKRSRGDRIDELASAATAKLFTSAGPGSLNDALHDISNDNGDADSENQPPTAVKAKTVKYMEPGTPKRSQKDIRAWASGRQ
jgi:hypothetical protein